MKNQRGVILILTMVMMAVLLATAVSFAVFIISDIRQAGKIDNTVVAYYAADSGIERSLYILRQSDEVDWVNTGATPTLFDVIGTSGINMDNGAGWNISNSTDYEQRFFRSRLKSGQAVKAYFLNRTTASSISINWSKSSDQPGARLQTIFTQLTPQSYEDDGQTIVVYNTDKNVIKINNNSPNDCEQFADSGIDGNNSGNNPPYDYVVEIRALGTAGSGNNFVVDDLRILAYDTDDCSGDPNIEAITNITLSSVGEFNGTRQEIVAHIPPRDPISGLLGFVLFSEEDITKSE